MTVDVNHSRQENHSDEYTVLFNDGIMEIPHLVQEYAQGRMVFCRCRKPEPQDSARSFDMDDPHTQFGHQEEICVQINDGFQLVQISTAEVLRNIPEHIMACMLLWEEGKLPEFPMALRYSPIEYVCHAVRLLVSLCPTLRIMESSLNMFDDTFHSLLIDSMTLILSAIASGKMKLTDALMEMTDSDLLRDAAAAIDLAPSCLQAVFLFLSEKDRGVRNIRLQSEHKVTEFGEKYEFDCVLHGLQLHPRGWLFLQTALGSTKVILQMLSEKLKNDEYTDLVSSLSIASSLEYSMRTFESLMAHKGIYQWYVQDEPNAVALLRVMCASLDLVTNGLSVPPFFSVFSCNEYTYEPRQRQSVDNFYPTDSCQGFAELIAARACAMIVTLGNHSNSFLDLVWNVGEESRCLAHVMNQNIMYVLVQVLKRPSIDCYEPSRGEGQLAINCLRAAVLLSSNQRFKAQMRIGIEKDVALLLCGMAPEDFRSFWGPGDLSVYYMAFDNVLVNSSTTEAIEQKYTYYRALKGKRKEKLHYCQIGGHGWREGLRPPKLKRGLKLSLERCVLLIKFILNLDEGYDSQGESTFLVHLMTLVKKNGARERLAENLDCLHILARNFSENDDSPLFQEQAVLFLSNVLDHVKSQNV